MCFATFAAIYSKMNTEGKNKSCQNISLRLGSCKKRNITRAPLIESLWGNLELIVSCLLFSGYLKLFARTDTERQTWLYWALYTNYLYHALPRCGRGSLRAIRIDSIKLSQTYSYLLIFQFALVHLNTHWELKNGVNIPTVRRAIRQKCGVSFQWYLRVLSIRGL